MNKSVRNKINMKIAGMLAIVIFVMLSFPAQTQSSTFDNSSLDTNFDFVIEVQTKKLQNYMTYTGSTLNPITQLSVSFRQTPSYLKNQISTSVQYEDLWYHDCHAIGCRRYNVFQIDPAEQGVIHFLASSDTTGSGCAIANCTARLLLDIGLNKSALSAVIVPADAVNSVVSEFEQFNFHPYTPKPDHGIKGSMSLYVCAEPVGVKQFLYYDGTNL